ncbi:shaggy-related protein kinase epsilon [Hibiscus syriacus]|uniref:Shaggy-related protein kinase epsilon n=1 Tax=Hibiscus syriacus TaxID=106335 RepID=A0A6A3C785_HIBSY|nr:shaggy-related protein kinase epsilon [Hibiscus syriacus]
MLHMDLSEDDFKDIDSSSDTEEILNSDSDEENKLLYLTKTEFSEAEASITMERYGPDSSIAELTDFICAAQMAKVADALLSIEDRKPLCNDPNYKKRQNMGYDFWKRKKQRKLEKKLINEDDYAVHLLNPMIGFGVPTEPNLITQNTSRRLLGLLISAMRTWRLLQLVFGPKCHAYEDEPFSSVQKYVLDECQKWNLVWVGRNKIIPLEPDEVEMLLEVVLYWLSIPLKANVQELNYDRLEQLMSRFVEFDLVVGGITCNNLTERNKHHQDELEVFLLALFLAMAAKVTVSHTTSR